MPKELFEKEKDQDLKLNYLYALTYELYRKRRWESIKIVFGGFMGGFVAACGKFLIWK